MSRRTRALRAMLREVDRRNRPPRVKRIGRGLYSVTFAKPVEVRRDMYPSAYDVARRLIEADGAEIHVDGWGTLKLELPR
jgi:hypothetical protein